MEQKRAERAKRVSRRQQNIYTRWIVIIITIVFSIVIGMQILDLVQLHNEKVRLEKQIEELQTKNDALEAEKNKLSDPKNVEGVARDELGLVKPGEVPYVK
ncbi:FtsB family cell division protein [Veillonella montpellierensis]|uniref:FtsB family cell division protein n=1 Tax=Veillonella montpellierensis TaxID=187328 RepID=UPI0004015E45|nr:septum formation initiator family protein [Veillonella montpellierensis]